MLATFRVEQGDPRALERRHPVQWLHQRLGPLLDPAGRRGDLSHLHRNPDSIRR
ncbi:MAG: hypothetical protein ACJ768_04455 [Gaiellaceae bacterium]